MYESELSAMGTAILIYFFWLLLILMHGIAEYLIWFHKQIRYHLQDKYNKSDINRVNDSKVKKNTCFANRPNNESDARFYDPEDVHSSFNFDGEDVHRSIHCEGDVVHRSVRCEGMDVSITISTVDEHLQSLCHNKNQARAHRIWRRRRGKIEEKCDKQSINEYIKKDDPVKETVVNAGIIHEEPKTSLDQPTCMFYNVSCHDEHGRELTLQIKSNETQIIKLNTSRHRRQKLRGKVENRCRTNGLENRMEMFKENP